MVDEDMGLKRDTQGLIRKARCIKVYLDEMDSPRLSEVQAWAEEAGYKSIGLWIKHYLIKKSALIKEMRMKQAEKLVALWAEWNITEAELMEAKRRLGKLKYD